LFDLILFAEQVLIGFYPGPYFLLVLQRMYKNLLHAKDFSKTLQKKAKVREKVLAFTQDLW
jgi:hypothetical protein